MKTHVTLDGTQALTNKTINGLTPTAASVGFTIAGGTTSKTLTVPLDASVSGTNTGDSATPAETTTTVGALINGATEKTTPVDADMVGLMDSAASNVLKKLSWANIKATLLTWLKLGTTIIPQNSPRGYLINGKIVPSVASNNLTVAIKGLDGNDPSASNPVYCRIGDTIRSITSALSVTKNAGTNWCNAGSSELATKEIDYFVYLGYNATDGVVIGFSRIPYANEYDDFSTTSTNEKYCAISTITNAAAGDDYENIGRFAATLSAGAGYTWSVPTYTNKNLIQRPIYETRVLVFNPTYSGSGSMTWSASSLTTPSYRLHGNVLKCWDYPAGTTGGSAEIGLLSTLPFTPSAASYRRANGCCADEGGGNSMSGYVIWNGSNLACRKYDNANWGIGANKGFAYEFEVEI